jgi:uncharacterized protein (TIGR03437 family)
VTIYSTGLNNTQPPLATGTIAPGAAPLGFPIVLSSTSGLPETTYAGAAPGLVAGLTQINFRIPTSIFHGVTVLSIQQPTSSSMTSQAGVYFYMQ